MKNNTANTNDDPAEDSFDKLMNLEGAHFEAKFFNDLSTHLNTYQLTVSQWVDLWEIFSLKFIQLDQVKTLSTVFQFMKEYPSVFNDYIIPAMDKILDDPYSTEQLLKLYIAAVECLNDQEATDLFIDSFVTHKKGVSYVSDILSYCPEEYGAHIFQPKNLSLSTIQRFIEYAPYGFDTFSTTVQSNTYIERHGYQGIEFLCNQISDKNSLEFWRILNNNFQSNFQTAEWITQTYHIDYDLILPPYEPDINWNDKNTEHVVQHILNHSSGDRSKEILLFDALVTTLVKQEIVSNQTLKLLVPFYNQTVHQQICSYLYNNNNKMLSSLYSILPEDKHHHLDATLELTRLTHLPPSLKIRREQIRLQQAIDEVAAPETSRVKRKM